MGVSARRSGDVMSGKERDLTQGEGIIFQQERGKIELMFYSIGESGKDVKGVGEYQLDCPKTLIRATSKCFVKFMLLPIMKCDMPLPNLVETTMPRSSQAKASLMLSYCEEDKSHVSAIKQKLLDAGFTTIYDYASPEGRNHAGGVVTEYTQAVNTHDVLIVLLSGAALRSQHVVSEISTALDKRENHGWGPPHQRPRTLFFVAVGPQAPGDLSTSLRTLINRFTEDQFVKPVDQLPGIIENIEEDFKNKVIDWWEIDAYSIGTQGDHVHCVKPDDTIAHALSEIRRSGYSFRHLPVTEDRRPDGKLQGVVSLGRVEDAILEHKGEQRVSTVMATFTPSPYLGGDFYYLHKLHTIRDALVLLTREKQEFAGTGGRIFISTLPIIQSSADDRLCGVVSYYDILKQMITTPPLIAPPPCAVETVIKDPDILTAALDDTVEYVKSENYFKNQNLIPIVERRGSRDLEGVITLRELKGKGDNQRMSEVVRPISEAATCGPQESIEEMLRKFLQSPRKAYKEYAMIVSKRNAGGARGNLQLEGLVSYVDVFRELLVSVK